MALVAGKNSINKKNVIIEELPNSYGLNRNVLGVPTFALHSKSATKLMKLEYNWQTKEGLFEFEFRRIDPDIPFPIPQHALYFDLLVALFAEQWNEGGDLYFTIASVLKNAGKDPDGRARDAVIETIKRYMFCNASWENSWNGRQRTWSNPLINACNIWDGDGNIRTGKLGRNPRNCKDRDDLHSLTFCKQIVDSLNDGYNRIFYTQAINGKLKPDSYAVYRYFYGFSDQSEVHRSLEHLMQVFPWTGRESRFKPWLESRLSECLDNGFIQNYKFKDDRVFVKCKNLKELTSKETITLDLEHDTNVSGYRWKKNQDGSMKKRKQKITKGSGATTAKRFNADDLTDEAVLEEYLSRKEKGLYAQKSVEVLDMLIEDSKDIKALIPSIRRFLARTEIC
jgi:hypothetical protein